MTKTRIKTIFHTVIFAYVYLMIALLVPTDYSALTPNKTKKVNDIASVEGVDLNQELYSVSVLVWNNISPFQRMIYELNPEFKISKMSTYELDLSLSERALSGQIQKNASIEQAIVTAYSKASEINENIQIDYTFKGLIVDYRQSKFSNLKIGDVITKINNKSFNNYDLMLEDFKLENSLSLEILRDNELLNINIDKSRTDLFAFYAKYQINNTIPKISNESGNIFSSGPSAGMMYTLQLYLSLINYKNINEAVVGTGTIEPNGKIGLIGGLPQKVYAAIKEGKKHFILPSSQLNLVEHLKNQINLYPVENIEDAIEVIYEIFN